MEVLIDTTGLQPQKLNKKMKGNTITVDSSYRKKNKKTVPLFLQTKETVLSV